MDTGLEGFKGNFQLFMKEDGAKVGMRKAGG